MDYQRIIFLSQSRFLCLSPGLLSLSSSSSSSMSKNCKAVAAIYFLIFVYCQMKHSNSKKGFHRLECLIQSIFLLRQNFNKYLHNGIFRSIYLQWRFVLLAKNTINLCQSINLRDWLSGDVSKMKFFSYCFSIKIRSTTKFYIAMILVFKKFTFSLRKILLFNLESSPIV